MGLLDELVREIGPQLLDFEEKNGHGAKPRPAMWEAILIVKVHAWLRDRPSARPQAKRARFGEERRTQRLNLLLRPSDVATMKALARAQSVSLGELVARLVRAAANGGA